MEKIAKSIIGTLVTSGEFDGVGYRKYVSGLRYEDKDILFVQASQVFDGTMALEIFISNYNDTDQRFESFNALDFKTAKNLYNQIKN